MPLQQALFDRAELRRQRKRRAPWRQRLVDAEYGLKVGLRADSTLFVYFFIASTVWAGAWVVGFTILEWAVVTLSLTIVLTAELFHQLFRALSLDLEQELSPPVRAAMRMATAAVFVAGGGAAITIALLFCAHLMTLWTN